MAALGREKGVDEGWCDSEEKLTLLTMMIAFCLSGYGAGNPTVAECGGAQRWRWGACKCGALIYITELD